MDENWPRWIMASVAKYFSDTALTIPLPLLVDGIDEREEEQLHYDHAELRVSGPHPTELSKDYFKLLVDINVLLTELMDRPNAYDLQTWCGIMAKAMEGPINIYKYGNETGDDSSWVFCLTPFNSRIEPNRILHFGQLGKIDRIRQSMIDGHFIVYLP
jgi:hypothetical protein